MHFRKAGFFSHSHNRSAHPVWAMWSNNAEDTGLHVEESEQPTVF